MNTAEPKPLTRGQHYELDTALHDTQRLFVSFTPRSPEWRAVLAEINRLTAILDADSAFPTYTTPAEHARLNVKALIAKAWLRYWQRQTTEIQS